MIYKMIRQSRCKVKFANQSKINKLDELTSEMNKVVNLYIDKLWDQQDFQSKFVVFKVETDLTARMQQCLGKIALQNVKSQKENKLKHKPIFRKYSFDLDNRFFDIEYNKTTFDLFIRLTSIKNKTFIKLPLNKHKHFNELINKGFQLKKSIRLTKNNKGYFIDFIFEKQNIQKRELGKVIGCDSGYNKMLVLSNGEHIGVGDMKKIYTKIKAKKQGSNAFKRSLIERDNKINELVNKIDLTDIKELVCEDLKKVKYKKKGKVSRNMNNKLARWKYPKVLDKLASVCEEIGITFTKVNPRFTSQKCSCCGAIHRESRKLENFCCIVCGFETDSDFNASVNLSHMGVYSPHVLSQGCVIDKFT